MIKFLCNPTTITQQHRRLFKFNCQLANLNRSGQYNNALHLFDKVLSLNHHLKPDHYTLSTTLAACANLQDTIFGGQLHSYSIKSGLKTYLHVSNTLLSLYAKAQDVVSVKCLFSEIENPDVYSFTTLLSACAKMGHVGYACEVFDEMPQREVAVWNAMITGCIEDGNKDIGFGLFRDMCKLGVRGDNYSFASVLSACCAELIDFGRQVHSLVVKIGFLLRTSVVNALITMYFGGNNVAYACFVFEEAKALVHDEITYNVTIDGLVSVGRVEEALVIFMEMLRACLRPTESTFVSILSSCCCARVGYQVHAQAIKMSFEVCTSVSNATMAMYSNCGQLGGTCRVFENLDGRDLVSWNTMISSYAQGNFGGLAISTYMEMQRIGLEPDEFTMGSVLASSEFIETAEMIHALVFRNGLISNIQVLNALASAYSKLGNTKQAFQIFSNMRTKNLISWNTIISGLLQDGLAMQGLEQFSKLLRSDIRPNEFTLSTTLTICASISALRHGTQLHGYILVSGFNSEGPLGNALITMYAKCGLLDWSLKVFNAMTEKDSVSWNALISAYAQHGRGKEAVYCFEEMQNSSVVKPDHATFTAVLSACGHAGLIDDGCWIFNSMVSKYGVKPGVDHFSCIVDLLGRAGYFDEVERIINSERFEAHPNMLWTLFSACVAYGKLKLGKSVAGFLLETEQHKHNPSVYVLLSNICAASGQWEEAATMRNLMNSNGVIKQPGYSWIN